MKSRLRMVNRIILMLIAVGIVTAVEAKNDMSSIVTGIHWFDQNWKPVSAHGAGIIKDGGKYYMFGEFKSDSSNAFTGFSCYSSKDLCNWEFECVPLPQQASGRLGPNRVGERPKVMKCPSTGEYVMYMHTDNMKYKDQCVGYATSDKVTGPYTFGGAILYQGKPIKKWDMGVFQDDDGKGYIITHSGNLYQLSHDYKSVTKQVVKNMTGKCESPAILKKDGVYFWLGSDLTSWERNDNYYFTATSLHGPWTKRGLFAPKGSLTWNSQSTFVLPIYGASDTTFIYMGDRWAFPRQNSSATYVWQPLTVSGTSISMPEFIPSWAIDLKSGKWSPSCIQGEIIESSENNKVAYKGAWNHSTLHDDFTDSYTDQKGAAVAFEFYGSRIGLYSVARPNGGYAQVELSNNEGEIILSTTIDMYCKYAESSMKFLSPILKKGHYQLKVTVIGEHGNWWNKRGDKFGSNGNFISLDKIVVQP